MSARERSVSDSLVEAGLILASELSLPAILQKIVELACSVGDARYGALGVLTPDGREIHDFITVGVTEEERRAIGKLPVGHGLLGALIVEAQPLRLRRIQDDPRSGGFPPHHPPMTSFLGCPIVVRGTVFGNLYLTEKRGASEFTADDQRAVETLAAQAGVAIENAGLRDELQRIAILGDRERIAKELHDGVIQSLFAVGLGLEATRQLASITPEIESRIGNYVEDIDHVIRDLRSYIFALRPGGTADYHVHLAIAEMVDGFRRAGSISIEARIDPHAGTRVSSKASGVLQAAREALSNAVRHAGASKIVLSLQDAGEDVVLEVADDGEGFNPLDLTDGNGLQNLRVRASELGGELAIESSKGRGTIVRLRMPAQ